MLPRRTPTPRSASPLRPAALAAAIFVSLAAVLRWQQDRVASPAALAAHLDSRGDLRPAAEVAALVRAMKLVTVQIDTTVAATRSHESWRGDVHATVRAPARLFYGADLSAIPEGAVRASTLFNSYIIRVPRPRLIAAEVYTERDEAEVAAGWLRLRSRAGEYYLGQARRSLSEQARGIVLSPEDAELVEEATRDQIRALVRGLVGDAAVIVLFDDEAAR